MQKHYHAGDSLGYVDGYCYMLLYRITMQEIALVMWMVIVICCYIGLWIVIGGYEWL